MIIKDVKTTMMNNENREYEGGWRVPPLRAKRREILRQNGFLPIEQWTLSKVPLNVPYLKMLRKDRNREYRQSIDQETSKQRYVNAIALKYVAMGWHQEGTRFTDTDVWKMLRWYEAEWRKTADPNDPYLLRQTRKHHGTRELLDRNRVLKEKRRYNALPSTKAKRAEYRRTHRTQIAEAERKRKLFKRGLGK
jgi:hypothetical protein